MNSAFGPLVDLDLRNHGDTTIDKIVHVHSELRDFMGDLRKNLEEISVNVYQKHYKTRTIGGSQCGHEP